MNYKKLYINIEENIKKNYEIYFSNNFEEIPEKISNFQFTKYAIIVDQNVYNIYKDFINEFNKKFKYVKTIVRPAGEEYKHVKYIQPVYEELIEWNIDRKSCIIALGGGVIGDFAGFIASTILRGIAYIQIPTTLLAMVDSSVGGKVAVNVDVGKNMVGSFFQPKIVLCYIDFLKTLPEKEWICGLSEMIKHSLLDKNVYKDFKEIVWYNPNYKNWDFFIWNKLIYQSIQVKANIVSKDEKETGLRSVLNLGHTVAHAIESFTNYKLFSHGEAVSRGLVCCLLFSKKKYNLSENTFEEIIKTMKLLNLPLDTANLNGEELAKHFVYDKKNYDGKIKDVYLQDIGKPIFDCDLLIPEFLEIWKEQKKLYG